MEKTEKRKRKRKEKEKHTNDKQSHELCAELHGILCDYRVTTNQILEQEKEKKKRKKEKGKKKKSEKDLSCQNPPSPT